MRECVREIETQKPHEARESDDEGGVPAHPAVSSPNHARVCVTPPTPTPPTLAKKALP